MNDLDKLEHQLGGIVGREKWERLKRRRWYDTIRTRTFWWAFLEGLASPWKKWKQ